MAEEDAQKPVSRALIEQLEWTLLRSGCRPEVMACDVRALGEQRMRTESQTSSSAEWRGTR